MFSEGPQSEWGFVLQKTAGSYINSRLQKERSDSAVGFRWAVSLRGNQTPCRAAGERRDFQKGRRLGALWNSAGPKSSSLLRGSGWIYQPLTFHPAV